MSYQHRFLPFSVCCHGVCAMSLLARHQPKRAQLSLMRSCVLLLLLLSNAALRTLCVTKLLGAD